MGFEPFIGEIRMFGFNFAPRGWAKCDGQLLPIASNSALFSLLGTMYGGDGRTTFGLPDLRSRIPMHAGSGPGLTPRSMGEKSGVENVQLDITQIPNHTHQAIAHGHSQESTQSIPTDGVFAKSGDGDPNYSNLAPNAQLSSSAITIGNSGGSQAHTNVQPFQCVNFCIALVGVFPSRN